MTGMAAARKNPILLAACIILTVHVFLVVGEPHFTAGLEIQLALVQLRAHNVDHSQKAPIGRTDKNFVQRNGQDEAVDDEVWPFDQIFGRPRQKDYSDRQRLYPTNALSLYQCMHYTSAIFGIRNITYWAGGGTLLGAVRNKGIIPHDNDIDIHILEEDEHKLTSPEVLADLDRNGMKLIYKYKGQWGITNKSLHRKPLKYGMKAPNGWIKSGEEEYPLWIDIYAMSQQVDKISFVNPDLFYANRYFEGNLGDLGLAEVPFGATTVFVPQKDAADVYLDRVYGTTWSTEVNCHGTYHGCRTAADKDWALKHHAEPTKPLSALELDPAEIKEPVETAEPPPSEAAEDTTKTVDKS